MFQIQLLLKQEIVTDKQGLEVMVFNATFNNISFISWLQINRLLLVVQKGGRIKMFFTETTGKFELNIL